MARPVTGSWACENCGTVRPWGELTCGYCGAEPGILIPAEKAEQEVEGLRRELEGTEQAYEQMKDDAVAEGDRAEAAEQQLARVREAAMDVEAAVFGGADPLPYLEKLMSALNPKQEPERHGLSEPSQDEIDARIPSAYPADPHNRAVARAEILAKQEPPRDGEGDRERLERAARLVVTAGQRGVGGTPAGGPTASKWHEAVSWLKVALKPYGIDLPPIETLREKSVPAKQEPGGEEKHGPTERPLESKTAKPRVCSTCGSDHPAKIAWRGSLRDDKAIETCPDPFHTTTGEEGTE